MERNMNPNIPSAQAAAVAEQVLQVSFGYMPAICLDSVTKLGVPDQLAKGGRPVKELAQAVGANEDALYRVMRALTTIGMFEETTGQVFSLTPASDMLRGDHPQS